MRTGFSDEFAHDARMARLMDERALAADDRTWRCKLEALYLSLLECESPQDIARCALELAEAAMELETDMAKEALAAPAAPIADDASPTRNRSLDIFGGQSLMPDNHRFSAEGLESDGEEEVGGESSTVEVDYEEEDSDDSMPEGYDGLTCPHGVWVEDDGTERCWKCRRAETPWDDSDDISEDIEDTVGRFGD